jgi:hypothetical protein
VLRPSYLSNKSNTMRYAYLTLFLGSALSLTSQVVINEVDYDQPGTDASEYLEIKNVGASDYPMQYVAVILVNGAGGVPMVYQTISDPSWQPLAPGAYFVICGNAGATFNCNYEASPMTNLIQNGPNDAIALVNTANDLVLDLLSYGGTVTGYVEGSGTTAADVNSVELRSLNRWPDGTDTNNNDADFQVGCSTPGATNFVDPVACDVPSSIGELAASTAFAVWLDPNSERLFMTYGLGTDGPVTFEAFTVDGALVASTKVQVNERASWTLPVDDLHGNMLLVRASTANTQLTRRVVLP